MAGHGWCLHRPGAAGEGKATAELAWRHGQLGLRGKNLQWGLGTVSDSIDFFCTTFHATQSHRRRRLEGGTSLGALAVSP